MLYLRIIIQTHHQTTNAMTIYKKIWRFAVCALIVAIAACGAFKQCDEVGVGFYNCLKNRTFDLALQYLDEEAIIATPKDIWLNGLQEKDRQLGFLLSVQRQDFESYTVDNVTRLAIKYKTFYSHGTIFERLEFIEREGDFKITFYQYNEDSTMVQ